MSTLAVGLAFALLLQAEAPNPVTLTAKSANVADPGVGVKVSILRWSTADERKPVVAALDPEAQKAAAKTATAEGRGGRGGRGAIDPDDPANADLAPAAGRGRGGRGGRGGDAAPPPDPIVLLTAALSKAPTVGYLWTNEIVGYSIKYAARFPSPDGGERIILLTDRRLGGGTVGWRFKGSGTPTDYEFTLIELRLDAKGAGEGKASLTSKVILDKEAGTLALENYAATPAIFQNVRR